MYLVANFTLFPLRAQTHVSKHRLKKRPGWEHCLHTLLDVPCSPWSSPGLTKHDPASSPLRTQHSRRFYGPDRFGQASPQRSSPDSPSPAAFSETEPPVAIHLLYLLHFSSWPLSLPDVDVFTLAVCEHASPTRILAAQRQEFWSVLYTSLSLGHRTEPGTHVVFGTTYLKGF